MVDYEKMAERVIEKAKAIIWSASESRYKSFWDELKVQFQYVIIGKYNNSTNTDWIDDMVHREIDRMLIEDGISKGTPDFTSYEREFDLSGIWSYIQERAESEEVNYNDPLIKYIKFHEDDGSAEGILVVAEVMKHISPEKDLCQVYSVDTPIEGEPRKLDLTALKEDCRLKEITQLEFEEIRKILFTEPAVTTSKSMIEQSAGNTAKNQDDKELKAKNLNTTSRALISVSEDGRVSVARFNPHFSAVRIDGVWSWGTFSPDDFKDNFRLILEDNEPALFHKLLNEASKALADIPKPKSIPVR